MGSIQSLATPAPPHLRHIPAGTMHGQCAACGIEHQAEWGVTIRRDQTRDISAYLRLCDECYRSAMAYLMARPDRGQRPLRGYT